MGLFIHDDFMLQNKTAKELYHKYAEKMPIYDYHCHLSPKDIAENRRFNNMTELWLEGDHYKWRAMRAHGIEEKYITGDASDWEKFKAWAETVPYTVGNPLYHWTHLELKRYFGVDELLNEDNWERIWKHCNTLLQQDNYTVQGLIKQSNVKLIGTTDEPTDDLRYHDQIKHLKDFRVKVVPTFRPDKGLEINKDTFVPFVKKLEEITGKTLDSFNKFLQVLEDRIDYFHDKGSRISDHGLSEISFAEFTESEVEAIYQAGRNGQRVSSLEEKKYKTAVLIFLAQCYKKRNWVMQIHFGAIRNNNSKYFAALGPDSGFDSINDAGEVAGPLNALFDALDSQDALPKMMLYPLNPIHYDLVASTIANFQTEAGVPGKMQLGAGWWFNDTKRGIIRQMEALADQGLLFHFVGMLTDSRSFISYSRHEYFRRIFCNLIGTWVENGEIPNDPILLKNLIENICFNNAKNYFHIEL
ncbi:glucuronate isomerase [Parageobacillus thermoglucosidasius]|uniref:glucuronate isomerase n=1 Tax=Parageobacillus thermoglucosidasius TaxID=1426 RepID=UPI000E156C17|nr:glucuronate isomerase [Parageobacillus thermoglucosidasius]RDE26985.1 glucuronate isomerase [Parageobacillus thermoglucosidasius]